MNRAEISIRILDIPAVKDLLQRTANHVCMLRRLVVLAFVLGVSVGLLAGCQDTKPEPRAMRFECHISVVRIFPDPSKPGEPIALPINPCGFKA